LYGQLHRFRVNAYPLLKHLLLESDAHVVP
jgi:hypothetical protein